MKGYKGFDKDLKCRGMQYEVGKTYEEDEAKLCEKGLHFCEAPLDVLNYYPVVDNDGNINRFCEVEAVKVSDEKSDDSKRVAKKLTVGAEMNIFDLAKAHIEYVKSTVDEGNASKNVGGNYSNNVGGYNSNNVGGDYSNNVGGDSSIIVATNGSIAKAGLNSVIVLTEWAWIDKELKPVAVCAKIVDGRTIKADTWYMLVDGKFTEVTDDDTQ